MDAGSHAAGIRVLSVWRTLRNPSQISLPIRIALVCIAGLRLIGPASAQEHPIDISKSVITVRVYKAGVLSAFGHDHVITAPIAGGKVDTSAHTVDLHLNAADLAVGDEGISAKDRKEIHTTMLGVEVLDAGQYPQIIFRSTNAEQTGPASWRVMGNLTLHGETRPVVLDVQEKGGRYSGTSRFRQTEFGIKPVKVAGGTIRVRDEIRIEFDIQLAH